MQNDLIKKKSFMKTKMMKTLFWGWMLLCLSAIQLHAQVTIGSNIEPLGGALLDLKEQQKDDGTANSTKGLLLPRVNLTSLTDITAGDISGVDASNKDVHTGLTVYNVNQCPAGRTIYDETGVQVWTGTRWESLNPRPAVANATPAQTSGANTWGTAVVRHQAKAGVYDEFYSAHFGAAGRWMTTNLTAWAYDGISHSASRTLTGPNANSGEAYNTAYWCYPKPDAPVAAGESAPADWNRQQGLLYTWDAATAGKGEADGHGSTTDETGDNTYPRVQGICPAGWHLPSDYEWTELENAIIKNTTNYANAAQNIDPGDDSALLPQANTSTPRDFRGTTHGQAMKDVCGVGGQDPKGSGKPLASGGFSVLPVSIASAGSTVYFGERATFWSSSSWNRNNALYRRIDSSHANVRWDYVFRYHLFSVRFKKD
jgi:uncharacterized protein (TIGR02145 family)